MGEIADMMLSGLLDCETGELIDGTEPGFPRTKNRPRRPAIPRENAKLKQFPCQKCNRKFGTQQGLTDHCRDKHQSQERQAN